jgi:hypothetical protein
LNLERNLLFFAPFHSGKLTKLAPGDLFPVWIKTAVDVQLHHR